MLARGHTGRDKVIKFEGHYHGWMDNINYQPSPDAPQAAPDEVLPPVPMSAGVPPSMADSIILVPWNDIGVLRRTVDEHAGEIAAIITEAIMCNSNVIFPRPGYLEGIQVSLRRAGHSAHLRRGDHRLQGVPGRSPGASRRDAPTSPPSPRRWPAGSPSR